jgi:hypothetical protein
MELAGIECRETVAGSGSSIQVRGELPCSEPLLELGNVDDAAAMGTIANLAAANPRLDLEHHAVRLDLYNASNSADRAADRRCGKVADFHVHADADEALRQM